MLTPPAAIEALLFASGEPMGKKRLAGLLDIKESELSTALEALRADLSGRGVTLVEAGDGIELRTAPDADGFVKKLRESEFSRELGKAGLETLAVIAYRDGATRGEIDWVRGVNSSASLRTLLLRGLVDRGEDPNDRRRVRYTLTTDALAHLGVSDISELPRHAELSGAAAEVLETAETDGASE